MHPSVHREIPEFIRTSIVYWVKLRYKKNEISCFILTKDLKFYEFRKKQLLHSIDLSHTFLSDLKQRIQLYDGRECKWLGNLGNKEGNPCLSDKPYEIKIEKYIYRNFDISKLYFLVLCWDKLVVLGHITETTTRGFKVIAQYENVANIEVIPGSLMKYQAVLRLKFKNGYSISTNFEESKPNESTASETKSLEGKSEFKQSLDRLRHAKAESQFHKEITHRKFENLRNTQTFGNDFLKSTCLDEKRMLNRCGDLWIRVTSSDDLVIGLPLANNCIPPISTILKNVHPILNIIPTTNSASSIGLSYDYRVYHLKQAFKHLDTLEAFFQSDEREYKHKTWEAREAEILPSLFVILVIKFKLPQVILLEGKCQLFVGFQIEKDFGELGEPERNHIFEQRLYIKSLDFQEILHDRQDYEISFSERTLHQDFLALVISSFEAQLHVQFASCADGLKCQQLLAEKFNFETVYRHFQEKQKPNYDIRTEIGEGSQFSIKLPCTLFYNNKPSSLWFGVLIKHYFHHEISDQSENFHTTWIFYVKNKEKALIMFKLILSELIAQKCNVIKIRHNLNNFRSDKKTAHFENGMQKELTVLLCMLQNRDLTEKKMKNLLKLQYNTDDLAALQY